MLSWLQKNLTRNIHTSSNSSQTMVALQQNKASWTPRNYNQLAYEGYQKNVLVYRCVNLIARSAASVPVILYQKEKEKRHEVEMHPILDLINKPNAQQSYKAFAEQTLSHLLLSGNSYIEGFGINKSLPHAIYALRPDRVEIIPGDHLIPKAYAYCVERTKRFIPIPQNSSSSPILQLRLFHPLNDWYGMSPLEAAARSIDEHNAVGTHNLSLLQNGGRPSGALIFKGDEQLTDKHRQELRESIQNIYQGENNAGRIAVMEGDFEWREMGLSPRDLDFIEGKYLSGREIAQAFGVPPMLLGIPGDATFANYKEARLHLWEDTILPLLDLFLKEITHWLCRGSYKDCILSYNSDSISALAPKRESLWNSINNAHFLTINEKREALGYGALETNHPLNGETHENKQ